MNNIEVIDALRHEIVLRRRHRGLSRRMVADLAGVAESSIANIENGKHFNSKTIAAICDALQIELSFSKEGKK